MKKNRIKIVLATGLALLLLIVTNFGDLMSSDYVAFIKDAAKQGIMFDDQGFI